LKTGGKLIMSSSGIFNKKASYYAHIFVLLCVCFLIVSVVFAVLDDYRERKQISEQITTEENNDDATTYRDLPIDATNVVDFGNHWRQFDLDGRTFIFYDWMKNSAVTEISPKQKENKND
jgi:hypothetical protein